MRFLREHIPVIGLGLLGCVPPLAVVELVLDDGAMPDALFTGALLVVSLLGLLMFGGVAQSLHSSVAARDELRIRLRRQEAVVELGELALNDGSWQALVDETCRVAASELGADLACVLELAPDHDDFVLRSGVGWGAGEIGMLRVPGTPSSHAGYTLATDQPVILRDAGSERRFALEDDIARRGIVSGISVRIGWNGSSYGVLAAYMHARRSFSRHDVTFLQEVATLLASVNRQRVAEQGAEKSLRVLEAVIEGTTDDVFVKDVAGRFVAANDAAARTLGYSREQLIGRTLHEILPADVADAMATTDRLTLERGVTETFEETIAIRGEPRVFLSAKGPYRASDGTLLGTFGIARDITDRKAQEQELARSEERLRLAQEGARMGTWDRDLVTGETTWSAGLRALYGVGPEYPALLDQFVPLVHPDDRECVSRKLRRAYATGADIDFEGRIIRPDGTLCWLLFRSTTLRDDEGTPTRFLGIAIDITEQKRAEEELVEARDYASRLIETSNAIVLVLDTDANVVTFNRAAEEITGYKREEVEGRNWDLLLPRDRYAEVWDAFATLIDEGAPKRYQNPIVTKSGEERMILWQNTQLYDRDGHIAGTVSFGIDVTETVAAKERSRVLEQQLRQAEKLEAIGQLAGGVAHDFNNLLLAIRGYSELALRKIGDSNNRLKADVTEILNAAERATDVTRQLLAFGRRQVLDPKVLDLNDVVTSVSALLRRVLGERVELVTRLADDRVVVRADRGQLEQVILNLAINARDAMPAGGAVTVEVAAASSPDGSDTALLRVSDEGAGIDAENLPHIFEPFFTTKGDAGTGLGLATVHGIVAQSGGQIAVESKPGRGTTFTVVLPLHDGVVPAERPQPVIEASGGNETILLIENDRAVRSILTQMLDSNGYRVISAPDGAQAIRAFESSPQPIHLVVSDLIMPGLDGRQAVERIRQIAPATRALYMSGHAADASIRGGTLPAGTMFIQKPFTGEELTGRIRELLDAAPE